jgi:hypothetical protein
MTEYATEGRRRADHPMPGANAGVVIDAEALRRSGSSRPIDQALDHVADRQSRTEHALDELGAVIAQLTDRLTHALTDGQPATYPEDGMPTAPAATPEPIDRRSTIAKALTGVADRADRHADTVQAHTRRLGALMDAIEV